MALSDPARKAMFASEANAGPRPGAQLPGTGPRLPRAPRMSKGSAPMPATFAEGGPVLQESRSRFFKTPDVFRTDIERNNYDKKTPGGELSKTTGDKSEKPIKPRA